MEAEICIMLAEYLGDDCDNEASLLLPVKRAISSYKTYMNYPKSFTAEKIEKDLKAHEFCLFDLALYMWNLQGIEFQKSHSENGTNRSFTSEGEIYSLHGIVPYVS